MWEHLAGKGWAASESLSAAQSESPGRGGALCCPIREPQGRRETQPPAKSQDSKGLLLTAPKEGWGVEWGEAISSEPL